MNRNSLLVRVSLLAIVASLIVALSCLPWLNKSLRVCNSKESCQSLFECLWPLSDGFQQSSTHRQLVDKLWFVFAENQLPHLPQHNKRWSWRTSPKLSDYPNPLGQSKVCQAKKPKDLFLSQKKNQQKKRICFLTQKLFSISNFEQSRANTREQFRDLLLWPRLPTKTLVSHPPQGTAFRRLS